MGFWDFGGVLGLSFWDLKGLTSLKVWDLEEVSVLIFGILWGSYVLLFRFGEILGLLVFGIWRGILGLRFWDLEELVGPSFFGIQRGLRS